jgi:hypothetical protein
LQSKHWNITHEKNKCSYKKGKFNIFFGDWNDTTDLSKWSDEGNLKTEVNYLAQNDFGSTQDSR